jgi:ribonuclease P protein component
MTILVLPNRSDTARLGVVASRKLGHAVERNRAKRLIRDLFRRHRSDLAATGVDVVVIPKRELLNAPYASLEADYRAVVRRHGRRGQ